MRLIAAPLTLLLFILFPVGKPAAETVIPVEGLRFGGAIVRDAQNIPHITAANEHDLFFLQGWLHAEDRLFQMDVARRQASGTLAELVGPTALAGDVEVRTIGIPRSAERSLPLLSAPVRRALDAYSSGVNAYLEAHSLPAEYDGLRLSRIPLWQPIDSVAVATALAFQNSFDLDISQTQALFRYQEAGAANGFDGFALFTQDINRAQPFAPAATIPDASEPYAGPDGSAFSEPAALDPARRLASAIRPEILEMAESYLNRLRAIPFFRDAVEPQHRIQGSNQWVIHGRHTVNGYPLFANDPHMALRVPPTFHMVHLATRGIDVIGASLPGTPFVVLGQNRHIAWGPTSSLQDVTDTYQERLVADSSLPSGLRTIYRGAAEPVEILPQEFRYNPLDPDKIDQLEVAAGIVGNARIPSAVLIVPRRNNGPIVELDEARGIALSVQYTGFSGSRIVDAFYLWNRARNPDDFRHGLQFFDIGSQNWVYADRQGNIAYFAGGEAPLREDLEAGAVSSLPPLFIRDGAGGNEWLPLTNPQPGQATPFEILPADEMPQLVNPPAGFIVSANNDPVGKSLDNDLFNQFRPNGGILYLGANYSSARAARITDMIREKLDAGAKLSLDDMKAMQADTVLYDAAVFLPYLLRAYDNATSAGAHPVLAAEVTAGVREAVARLRIWDLTSPTGLDGGSEQAEASVAATLYAVWRAKAITNIIDAPLSRFGLIGPSSRQAISALRHHLDRFEENQGVGASGVDFFALEGVADADARRDILLMRSLGEALGLLPALFGGSTDQADYRWGVLHQAIFRHPLGGGWNIPPALGASPPPVPNRPGIPIDGGFETVDAAGHNIRATTPEGFLVGSGAILRLVAELTPHGPRGEASLAGGQGNRPDAPDYLAMLDMWLANDTFPLRNLVQATRQAVSVQAFVRRR